MNTENHGINMNITICNEKTNKHLTICKIDPSLDLFERLAMLTTIMGCIESLLGTELKPTHVDEKGYIVNLSEDQLSRLILKFHLQLQFFDINEEEGQVVADKDDLVWFINELRNLF